jgi:hypothetical protein
MPLGVVAPPIGLKNIQGKIFMGVREFKANFWNTQVDYMLQPRLHPIFFVFIAFFKRSIEPKALRLHFIQAAEDHELIHKVVESQI